MAMGEEVTRWKFLAEEAKAGRLYLDQSVAKDCRDACNKQIDLYDGLRRDLKNLETVTGLGNFKCAEALAQMLGRKAIGGEGNVDAALMDHIEVLKLIRDTIQVSVEKYESQDKVNAGEQDKLLS
ncbi:hypothetical protein [Nocardia goodfellowii]|uniref:DUF222 domain-containing protein n=1 Tax=Nocardia goodfellowii TaxID=882446 RepID=A0ABS4QKW1_9NOCA|nr:hypothetical protein [Nocardia goodfellowii]MBP2192347.1 hypothetical protein [Nocardia goodfellowii]